MKKTYITTMPDQIGAFLKASECFASLGVNITRVSYNKAIDSHTLFIDADGGEEQLAEADRELIAGCFPCSTRSYRAAAQRNASPAKHRGRTVTGSRIPCTNLTSASARR